MLPRVTRRCDLVENGLAQSDARPDDSRVKQYLPNVELFRCLPAHVPYLTTVLSWFTCRSPTLI